jgi:outer membrane biosynthesis protein TonB
MVKTAAPLPLPTPAPLEVVLQPPPEPPPEEALKPAEEEQLQQLFQALPEEVQRNYLDVEGLAKKKNLSKRALLESWADSVAGSVKRGKGDSPLPSQEGRDDLNFTNFKNQQAQVGDPKKEPGAETHPPLPAALADPAPLYKPEPVAKPDLQRPDKIPKTASRETPTPTPTPPPAPSLVKPPPPPELKRVAEASKDEIPMYVLAPPLLGNPTREVPLRPNPDPVPKAEPTPIPTPARAPTPQPTPTPKADSLPTPKAATNKIEAARMASLTRPTPVQNPGYSPNMEKRKIEGGDAPPGENGVDAVGTERGRYIKALNQTVGSRWTYYVRDAKHASIITVGTVTLKFALNAKGKIVRLQVTDNTSNSAHAALCERAFLESQTDIDPPPRELLRNGIFEDTVTFQLY